MAREYSPSIILFDEIDTLARRRNANESDSDRRIKGEFLTQMDNIAKNKEIVTVLATTNIPWEFDISALRKYYLYIYIYINRFSRKILVPMPNKMDRKAIIRKEAGERHILEEADLEDLAEATVGYSGSDLSTVVNDALMRPIRELQKTNYFKLIKRYIYIYILYNRPDNSSPDLEEFVWTPIQGNTEHGSLKDLTEIEHSKLYVRHADYVITIYIILIYIEGLQIKC